MSLFFLLFWENSKSTVALASDLSSYRTESPHFFRMPPFFFTFVLCRLNFTFKMHREDVFQMSFILAHLQHSLSQNSLLKLSLLTYHT